jgi:hypothetical protein
MPTGIATFFSDRKLRMPARRIMKKRAKLCGAKQVDWPILVIFLAKRNLQILEAVLTPQALFFFLTVCSFLISFANYIKTTY